MGLLPFKTERGDRIFISAALFIAICLLWMKYLESYLYVAVIISMILSIIIIKWG